MPKRIVKDTITLYRDGAFVRPEVGSVFNFTEAELKSINASNPKAIEHIVVADEAPVLPKAAETTLKA